MGANRGDGSPLLFYKPPVDGMWDNVLTHTDDGMLLYYQDTIPEARGYGLSTSRDGVHWDYRGLAYDAHANGLETADGGSSIWTIPIDGKSTHVMTTASFGARTITALLASDDLYHWRLLREIDFYFGEVAPREGDGFEAWSGVMTPEGLHGDGILVRFESDDGLEWREAEPVPVTGLRISPSRHDGIELSGVLRRDGKQYFLLGMNDLDHTSTLEDPTFAPGCTTFIAESEAGPLRPAPRNRRLVVTNNSYFLRFSHRPGQILVNHQTYEPNPAAEFYGLDGDRTYLAPLKLAEWDDEGTLRLTYWPGNDSGKSDPVPVAVPRAWSAHGVTPIEPVFDTDETMLLEGIADLTASGDHSDRPVGLYLAGDDGTGTAFLIRRDGVVEFGAMDRADRDSFAPVDAADREIRIGDRVRFRLIRRRSMVELYVDDYLMPCITLPVRGTGEVGLIGASTTFSDLTAWYCRG